MTEKAWKKEEFRECLEIMQEKEPCFSCGKDIPAGIQALNILGLSDQGDTYACLICCMRDLDNRLTHMISGEDVKELQTMRVIEEL